MREIQEAEMLSRLSFKTGIFKNFCFVFVVVVACLFNSQMIFIKGERHRNRELVKSHRGNNHHEVGNLSKTALGGWGVGVGG